MEQNDETVHVILVHGTFAPDAAWTQATSPLCVCIAKALEGRAVRFEQLSWSGANRHADRIEAGNALAAKAIDLIRAYPGNCFLVGHSHGGTVITQALNRSLELSAAISGAVFLATPFIQVHKKDYASKLISWVYALCMALMLAAIVAFTFATMIAFSLPLFLVPLMWPAMIVCSTCVLPSLWRVETWKDFRDRLSHNLSLTLAWAIVTLVYSGLEDSSVGKGWVPALLVLAQFTLASACASLIVFLRRALGKVAAEPTGRPVRLESAIARAEADFATIKIRSDRALFIRGNSDEANAGLVWLQVYFRILGLLVSLPLRSVEILWDSSQWHSIWRRMTMRTQRLIKVLLALAFGPFALISVLFTCALIWTFGFLAIGAKDDPIHLIDRLSASFHAIPWLYYSLKPATLAVAALEWSLPLFALCGLLGALGLSILGRAYGSWFIWTSPFLTVSVEPVPPGEWKLIQVDQSSSATTWDPLSPGELAHSIYQSPVAQDAVAVWIRSRCG